MRWPGRTPAARQAGEGAAIPTGSSEEGQGLHAAPSPPPPPLAPWHSRAPPDPTVVLFQCPGLVTCEQHGRWESGGGREACKQSRTRRDPASSQLPPHIALRSSMHTQHRQEGLSCQSASAPHQWGGQGGRQSCLLLRAVSPRPAQAGAPLPAAAPCAGRAPLGHQELPASAGGRPVAPPSPASTKAVGEVKSRL